EYNRRYQATILLTSHYMADITALCKRVILIHQGQLIYDGSLEGLLEQFSPYREVTIELEHYSAEVLETCRQKLLTYAEIESMEGQVVRLLVKRDTLTTTVAKILAEFNILDLTVSDPPIENVIGRVFRAGVVD
ncbi:MAG: ABC transporter, partial [Planktothrix sp.]